MTMLSTPSYRSFRFLQEVIAHAVWLYHRFPLSFRDVEELLYEHRELRNDPPVVPVVRADLRQPTAPTASADG